MGISLFVGIFFFNVTIAQSCNCSKDFLALDQLLRKTPAFKDNKQAYLKVFDQMNLALAETVTDYDCMVLLNQLSLGVNDNHIKIYGVAGEDSPQPIKSSMNTDSLSNVLKNRPLESIEGIYSLKDNFSIGLIEQNKKYIGIVLNSNLPNWQAGDMYCTLIPYGDDLYLNIVGQLESKRLVSYSERIKNGHFLKIRLQKKPDAPRHHSVAYKDSLYIRKEIDAKTTYIKVGSFNSFYPTLSDAEAFYATLKNTLNKKKLIVDLRDNGGGGQRNSNILLEILTQYAEKNNIYVLTNHNTASNAEQFTVKLKRLPNTQILGDKTQGTLSYELKKNISNNLPCGKFIAIMTSKKHKEYLEFESKGVSPDILLEYNKDWIDQTKELIQTVE